MTIDFNDLAASVRGGRVHRSIYVDPAIFEREMEQVFGRTWVYLCHESQIPDPHDFVSIRLGRRPLLVTRDDGGQIHALFNRCAHRASTVCQEEQGNAKRFQCSYHGWTYSSAGKLVGLPFPKGYSDLDRSELGLQPIARVESYRGFIFGSLTDAVPSVIDWLGPAHAHLDDFIDRAPGGRLRVGNPHRLRYRGNWKLAWDNAADGLHATYAHKSFVILNEERYGGARSLSQFKATPDDSGMYTETLGNGHVFLDQRPGMSSGFWDTQRPIPGRETYGETIRSEHGDEADDILERAPGSMVNLSIFPNLLILGNQLEVINPVSVDQTELHIHVVAAEDLPEEVNVLRMRIAEDFPSLGNQDDLEIFERCQDGLQIPEFEWIHIGKGIGDERETVEVRDGVPVTISPVTYEAPIRAYLDRWLELMRS